MIFSIGWLRKMFVDFRIHFECGTMQAMKKGCHRLKLSRDPFIYFLVFVFFITRYALTFFARERAWESNSCGKSISEAELVKDLSAVHTSVRLRLVSFAIIIEYFSYSLRPRRAHPCTRLFASKLHIFFLSHICDRTHMHSPLLLVTYCKIEA